MKEETAVEIAGKDLVPLWLEIIGRSPDDIQLQATLNVLTQIANAPSETALKPTQWAVTFNQLVEGFETERVGNATELIEQAKRWYDHVEEIFSYVVDAYSQGRWGVGNADENLRMRRLVGISTLLGITSPSVKVPQNILMTLVGATVSEIQLGEMLEEAKKTDPFITFDKLVERVTNDYETLRKFLNGVEEKIFSSPTKTEEGRPLSAFVISAKEAPAIKPEAGKETVFQPTFTEKDTTAILKGREKTLKVTMTRLMSNNMLRGILSYVDALSRPELGGSDLVSKWTAKEFFDFYAEIGKQLMAEETPQVEREMLSAFIEREKHLRFGKGRIPAEKTEAVFAPIAKESPAFATALRRFIMDNFGATASKTKSFSVSAFFSAVAEKLGIGSSILPSLVFDTWMNANLHTMLREIDEIDTRTPRLGKINSVVRQAILPYGFDVEMSGEGENVVVRLKDYLEGKVYERKGRSYEGKPFTDPTDVLIHNRFAGKEKGASSIYQALANAFRERRMYLYSPPEAEQAQRLIDVTKVGAYGKSELSEKEPKKIRFVEKMQTEAEEAGKLMFKDIEDLLKHWMTTYYTEDERVFVVKGNSFFDMLQRAGAEKYGLIKTATVGDRTLPAIFLSDVLEREDVFLKPIRRGEYVILPTPEEKTSMLRERYKAYIDRFRSGGFISLLGEQVVKNALYLPEGAKEGEGRLNIRALQALVWVCTRKGL